MLDVFGRPDMSREEIEHAVQETANRALISLNTAGAEMLPEWARARGLHDDLRNSSWRFDGRSFRRTSRLCSTSNWRHSAANGKTKISGIISHSSFLSFYDSTKSANTHVWMRAPDFIPNVYCSRVLTYSIQPLTLYSPATTDY